MVFEPAYSIAGAGTGFLVGLTGVGGGALMTPLLLLFFGVAPQAAVGTDLWFAAITKLVAVKFHNDHGLVDWQVVRRLWLGSLPAALITLIVLKATGSSNFYNREILALIGVVVLVTAASMLCQPMLHARGRQLRLAQATRFKAMQPGLTVLLGALLGILVTVTSIGAGALGAVILNYLYPLRLTPVKLVATDIVHAIPLAVLAGLGHLYIGNVDAALLAALLLGSIPAVVLGSYCAKAIPQACLRLVLSIILAVVGLKLL